MIDLKQIQKMQREIQEQVEAIQREAERQTVEASSGGGAVRVVANGAQQIVEIEIRPDAVDPDDIEMLEDLVVAAVNSAIEKSKELTQKEMTKLTGGIKLPMMF
ncbi:MAG: YbaB/EbfC family nucleoid-associated protein [Candidatus Sumerlaeia bacterium]|nr:YbaB/EbfC family nucleoid-associated protein [Candidatus Sumerlaeia bacterium]